MTEHEEVRARLSIALCLPLSINSQFQLCPATSFFVWSSFSRSFFFKLALAGLRKLCSCLLSHRHNIDLNSNFLYAATIHEHNRDRGLPSFPLVLFLLLWLLLFLLFDITNHDSIAILIFGSTVGLYFL